MKAPGMDAMVVLPCFDVETAVEAAAMLIAEGWGAIVVRDPEVVATVRQHVVDANAELFGEGGGI